MTHYSFLFNDSKCWNPNAKPIFIGTKITNMPQCPKYSVIYTKPNEVIRYTRALESAYETPVYVKRLKTGKCLKKIGTAGTLQDINIINIVKKFLNIYFLTLLIACCD